VVHEDKDTGLLSVSYSEILPVLIEAFKDFLNQYKGDKEDTQLQLNDLRNKLQILSEAFQKSSLNGQDEKVAAIILALKTTSRKLSDAFRTGKLSTHSSLSSIQPNFELERKKKDSNTFCKVGRMLFTLFFIVFFVFTIVGVVLVFDNSAALQVLGLQSSSPSPAGHVKDQVSGGGKITDPASGNVVVGLVLFGVGTLGLMVTGIGLCCSSLFLCSQLW